MCMFSGPPGVVDRVDGTSIFARALDDDQQALIYSMNVAASEPVAMILPLPVPPRSPDDAVRFVDLSAYPTLFQDLASAFPPLLEPMSRGGTDLFAAQPSRIALPVHEVGAFEASFVPSLGDFDRLDPRFQLADDVWAALPQYADYGFAVFQLQDVAPRGFLTKLLGRVKPKTIHPMAFVFPRRDPTELFFPTVHVHDGSVHPRARFNHHLYLQLGPRESPPSTGTRFDGWERNDSPLADCVDGARVADLVDVTRPCFTQWISGERDNADILVTPSAA